MAAPTADMVAPAAEESVVELLAGWVEPLGVWEATAAGVVFPGGPR